MVKAVSILGSTGSIGKQSLEVVKMLGCVKVKALSTNTNIELLEEQVREFKPEKVCVFNQEKALEFKKLVRDTDVKVLTGIDGLVEIAVINEIDTVITSVVGTIGLIPTIEAINAGKNIALANKETLVAAGELVTNLAKEKNVKIIPVDSEHSAVFQCLMGMNSKNDLAKIILTASGGPFREKTIEELKSVTLKDALKHPNWNMGKKITIDSATMMNKGLEVIEAFWLFNVEIDQIEVIIHPQSIVHSMVEMIDGSVIAQLGMPDMRVPIQFALTYPERRISNFPKLSLADLGELTFKKPDMNKFRCLKMAFDALKVKGTMPAVMNAANEIAVEKYLLGKIGFLDIAGIIDEVMRKHKNIYNASLQNILEADKWARETTNNIMGW
ncbi:MAG: 1-deoxy-D-xylulose-5-phosphate reductoisomerase [Deltaproteobacteria bacterium]